MHFGTHKGMISDIIHILHNETIFISSQYSVWWNTCNEWRCRDAAHLEPKPYIAHGIKHQRKPQYTHVSNIKTREPSILWNLIPVWYIMYICAYTHIYMYIYICMYVWHLAYTQAVTILNMFSQIVAYEHYETQLSWMK